MKKIFFLVLLLAAAGFSYSPYRTTSAYASAVRALDVKTVNELTDHASYFASLHEGTRRIVRDHFREQIPFNTPSKEKEAILKARVAWWVNGLRSITGPENTEANLNSLGQTRLAGFDFPSRGWRSPFVFVAVDSDNHRTIWRFNLAGWKLSEDESPREIREADFHQILAKLYAKENRSPRNGFGVN